MDEATEQQSTEKEALPSATDAAVEAWFVETFHNIGLDVTLYNRFYAAKDKLKAQLAAALAE